MDIHRDKYRGHVTARWGREDTPPPPCHQWVETQADNLYHCFLLLLLLLLLLLFLLLIHLLFPPLWRIWRRRAPPESSWSGGDSPGEEVLESTCRRPETHLGMDALKSAGRAIIKSPGVPRHTWGTSKHESEWQLVCVCVCVQMCADVVQWCKDEVKVLLYIRGGRCVPQLCLSSCHWLVWPHCCVLLCTVVYEAA